MADRPPVSVLLPTTRWTDACGELADQLEDHDDLLLIHDVEDDPVTDRQTTPEGVRLIAAGEPEYCSGKANAIAAGMEAACHDRLVWTDDDFHHPPDWLATLSADYEEYGPVSEVYRTSSGGIPYQYYSNRCMPRQVHLGSIATTESGAARSSSTETISMRPRFSMSFGEPPATTDSSWSTSR